MTLVSAGIMPHGFEAVSSLSRDAPPGLTVAMRSVAGAIRRSGARTVVLATPHNVRIRGMMGVVMAEHYAGAVSNGRERISVRLLGDRELAEDIYRRAHMKGLHVVSVNYGTDGGPESKMPLDWGAVIPLWFLRPRPKLVLVTPSREIPWKELVALGGCIRDSAADSKKSIAFVASADQAHAHLETGPYGHDPAAETYDSLVYGMVKEGRLGELLRLDPSLVDHAKPDSLWQMLILHGVVRGMRLEHLSYHRPTYFGMLCASFLHV